MWCETPQRYVGDEEEATNKQQAIWRQDPKEVTEELYDDFYKMLTLDSEPQATPPSTT